MEASPRIIAGKDLRVGGTWMGVSEYGLFAGILNRRSSGEVAGTDTRSRGLLCLDLLKSSDANKAASFIGSHRERYQPFIVVVADQKRAWAAYNSGERIQINELSPGLHVFSSHAEVDWRSEKADRAAKQFATLLGAPPQSDSKAFVASLQTFLSDHTTPAVNGDSGREAICVHGEVSGTVSASIAILSDAKNEFEFFHCPGAPCQNSFAAAVKLPIQ
jgi:uncharacterized protein with NRDE domain